MSPAQHMKSTFFFYSENGGWLRMPEFDLLDLIVDVAAHRYDVQGIAERLREHAYVISDPDEES